MAGSKVGGRGRVPAPGRTASMCQGCATQTTGARAQRLVGVPGIIIEVVAADGCLRAEEGRQQAGCTLERRGVDACGWCRRDAGRSRPAGRNRKSTGCWHMRCPTTRSPGSPPCRPRRKRSRCWSHSPAGQTGKAACCDTWQQNGTNMLPQARCTEMSQPKRTSCRADTPASMMTQPAPSSSQASQAQAADGAFTAMAPCGQSGSSGREAAVAARVSGRQAGGPPVQGCLPCSAGSSPGQRHPFR